MQQWRSHSLFRWSGPSAGNLAGGGFMVIRDGNGNARVVDYREIAPPLAATRDMYLDEAGKVIAGSRIDPRLQSSGRSGNGGWPGSRPENDTAKSV